MVEAAGEAVVGAVDGGVVIIVEEAGELLVVETGLVVVVTGAVGVLVHIPQNLEQYSVATAGFVHSATVWFNS